MKQLQDEVDAAYEEANGQTPDYSVVQVSKKPWVQSYKANFGINYCKFSYDIHPKQPMIVGSNYIYVVIYWETSRTTEPCPIFKF